MVVFPRSAPTSLRNVSARGFTLVELLVVITIIGILVALLLPAVQAAREAARLTQCANHLKQISLAALNHEQVMHWLPSGGWGLEFAGDPTGGYGPLQPGGFFYNILPYMEQQAVHDFALSANRTTNLALYQQLSMEMTENVISTYSCPTRRKAVLHPVQGNNYGQMSANYSNYLPQNWFQGDYSANAGTVQIGWWGPDTWSQGTTTPAYTGCWLTQQQVCQINGICFQRSQVRLSAITDGMSCTYLVGEKYMDADEYYTGQDYGDDQSFATGDDDDPNRWAGKDTASATGVITAIGYNPPLMDMPGYLFDQATMFGSAHLSGFQMAFCDGSVHRLNFSIDPETHRRLGARNDGLRADPRQY